MFRKNSVVLIVDDSITTRQKIVSDLNQLGFMNILEANNGNDAFDMLESAEKVGAPVKFVITDWKMPIMSGLAFLQKIRAHINFGDLPVVMMTTNGDRDSVIKAFNEGISSYIIKPHTTHSLKEGLEIASNWQRNPTT